MIIRNTYSLCPVCLTRISASIVNRENDYHLEKSCPEHGAFSTVIWRGNAPSLEEWEKALPSNFKEVTHRWFPTDSEAAQLSIRNPQSEIQNPPGGRRLPVQSTDAQPEAAPNCPDACGLCAGHMRQTCCALVEVTSRCNLACPVCFAQSVASCEVSSPKDPTVKELSEIFRKLADAGRTFVQLSGGEPTIRDDLPEIVAAARAAGCETVQLNSNGVRLGDDKPYAMELAAAGLSFVFMQFDGTDDAIYEKLRGRPLLDKKLAAINVCSELGLGAALVPTLVPGVNDGNIGEILDFAIANSPAVRGVHFQPAAYFGRYPAPPTDELRITLPETLRAMEAQTGGRVKASDFIPSGCDHPRCGFHGDFVVFPGGVLRKLTGEASPPCCEKDDGLAHIRNRNFVARRWKRPPPAGRISDFGFRISDCNVVGARFIAPTIENHLRGNFSNEVTGKYPDMDIVLDRIKSHGFTITAMAFQDAWTIDLERLRRCSLHVYRDGCVIPFCARYLTAGTQV